MQVQESAIVSIEPGLTVGDLLGRFSKIDQSAVWSGSLVLKLSFIWDRDETDDEKQARETVEQRAQDLKQARIALQQAQTARASIAKVEQ